jgi:hypothetical protein
MYFSVLWYVRNDGLFCFCSLGFEKLAWRCSVPSISLVYCKVTVWLLTFNFIHFMTAFWTVFTFGGSGPALTAHDSLGLNKKFTFKFTGPVIWMDLCKRRSQIEMDGRGLVWFWFLLYAHRHQSILWAAGHIMLNQLMVMGFKIWSLSNPCSNQRPFNHWPTNLPTTLTGPTMGEVANKQTID